jgi:prepilin-type N-terminal cleavage/methylation domain-containing protein
MMAPDVHRIIRMRNERGFTLIETLTAAAILAFGVAAVASLISVSIGSRARAEWQSRATRLATDRLEALRLEVREHTAAGGTLDAGSPSPGFHDYLALDPAGTAVSAGPSDGVILRLWRIEPGQPVRIGVAVYWRGEGRPRLLATAVTALAGVR